MSNLTAQQIYEQTRGSRKKIVGTYFTNNSQKIMEDYPNEEVAIEDVVQFLCENPDILPQMQDFYTDFLMAMEGSGDYEKLHEYSFVKQMARELIAKNVHDSIELAIHECSHGNDPVTVLDSMQDDWCSDKNLSDEI